jgi:hypothetical protein
MSATDISTTAITIALAIRMGFGSLRNFDIALCNEQNFMQKMIDVVDLDQTKNGRRFQRRFTVATFKTAAARRHRLG